MPQMDGFEATRIIRDPASRVLDHAVPVIAMTANAFAEDRERCLAAGMNEFLAKPVDRQTLAAMLSRWIAPPDQETNAAAGQGGRSSLARKLRARLAHDAARRRPTPVAGR